MTEEMRIPAAVDAPVRKPDLPGISQGDIESMRFGLANAGPIAQAVLTNNAQLLSRQLFTLLSVPVGTIITYAGSTIPPGYLDADGSSKVRAEYPELFAAIGTTYGDGTTPGITFALPNFVGTTGNFIIKH